MFCKAAFLSQQVCRFSTVSSPRLASATTRGKNNVILTSSAPTAIPLYDIIIKMPRLFPRSWKLSFKDYMAFQRDDTQLQKDLLSCLPFYPNEYEGRVGEIITTPVGSSDPQEYINEFCIRPTNPSVQEKYMKHLIFIHGYGAGLGFFFKNLEHIPLLNNEWCIHAIDLPGFGFSSRLSFPFQFQKHSVEQVQDWFHSRIQDWFHKRGLAQNKRHNIVVAHSLGAYLMALYVDRKGTDFQKIVMCSPAGICKSSRGEQAPPWWFTKLWDLNMSPFSLVRNSYYLGSKLTSGWSYRRFSTTLPAREQFEAMHRYTYAIFNRPGCGEYLLGFALSCGGEPRKPLEEAIFLRQPSSTFSGIATSPCEWLWVYGEQDWMNVEGAHRVSAHLQANLDKTSSVQLVPRAGHHLYLDNYKYFNDLLIAQMQTMQ